MSVCVTEEIKPGFSSSHSDCAPGAALRLYRERTCPVSSMLSVENFSTNGLAASGFVAVEAAESLDFLLSQLIQKRTAF